MKASELRIGNYVKSNDVNMSPYFIVTASFLKQNENEMSWFIDPIPLTEEWLFNFGFEIGYNQKKMLDVYCKDFGLLIERSNSNNFYYKKVNIHSVHQLQNLYFALTGIELTFKSE